ncbi:MAG: hypothetical protein K9G49_07760 [Taibaiella sp.]|nr:hypothetical protein [Taibaiella sp.]
MIKLILVIVLIASTTGCVYAQSSTEDNKTFDSWEKLPELDRRFNSPPPFTIRDAVALDKARVIFELWQTDGYRELRGIDTILELLRNDIGFYHDSLENGSSGVRIDYIYHTDKKYREMRFIKHTQNGTAFVKRNGNTELLKTENDTIRVLVKMTMPLPDKLKGWAKKVPDVCLSQTTIILNSYADIDQVVAQKEVLLHAIDTFVKVRETHAARHRKSGFSYSPYQVTDNPLQRRFATNRTGSVKQLAFHVNACVGVVRNTLTPFADIGISLYAPLSMGVKRNLFTSVSASPFFFFERGADRDFYLHDNWFVNLERGGTLRNNILGFNASDYSYGIGYLAVNKGNYFKGVTMKFFITATILNGITFSPEVIATNTFGQFFPGFSIKIKAINTYN